MSSPEDGTIDEFYPFHTPMDEENKNAAEDFRLYIFDETLDNQTLANLTEWAQQHDISKDMNTDET